MDNKKNKTDDLGLGDRVVQENRTRFINHDGSFNVRRKGEFKRGNFSPYHAVLNASWPKFYGGVVIYYIVINFLFVFLYIIRVKTTFPEIAGLSFGQKFSSLFFYSVQVISTLGSSPLHPVSVYGQFILALEAMVGLFGFALGASLMFARFSNPAVKILFSQKAVLAPYQVGKGFMIRIINGRSNELIQVSAVVTVSMKDSQGVRRFYQLPLERDTVQTFPVNWTIVHPIDEASPLYGKSLKDLFLTHAEFVVNITAVDPDLSRTVYARRSYVDDEVVEGKFAFILERDEDGTVVVDPARISEIEQI